MLLAVQSWMPLIVLTAISCVCLLFLTGVLGIRYIPNKKVGVVERLWSTAGSVRSGIIALKKEAGFQPEVLRGGLHFLTPFQYRVHVLPLVTIAQGQIGYVFARDGQALPPTQTLGCNSRADNFEDSRSFLAQGGQRGPQRKVLREGTYAINLAQFAVVTRDQLYFLPLEHDDKKVFAAMQAEIASRYGFVPVVIKGNDDLIGVVTVHDGPALPSGEIIAPIVGRDPQEAAAFHNNFQDPEKFLMAGGARGRQLQVLVDGTYYLNRLFATVEMLPKTVIDVGHVGVVISYTGARGADLSGTEYKHGELVRPGERGVWSDPLLPGKYAFNTYAGKVIPVPTTNFILKWIKNEAGNHRFDENLREVSLITKDAFEPSLPLSVVVHIDYRKAPLVIQRFGDVKKLVEQTLDPMVSAYFKNIGQTRTLIQLLQDRAMIQKLASEEMQEKFTHYNLELEEVLIGTPTSSAGDNKIENILTQLRLRQVAEEQVETYARQEKAAVKERELREAEAKARQQQQLTESELSIRVQENQGKADYQRALQQAAQTRATAEAEAAKVRALADAEGAKVRALGEGEAARIRAIGEAEADKNTRIGVAQAIAIDEQVRAYGGPQFQLTRQVMERFAEAIQHSGVDLVPKIVIGGGSADGKTGANGALGANVMESLLTLLLSDRLGLEITDAAGANGHAKPRPETARLREELQVASGARPRNN